MRLRARSPQLTRKDEAATSKLYPMPIDERWERLSPADWNALARAYLQEIRDASAPWRAETDESDWADDSTPSSIVTMMSFTARPEQQFQFIRAATAYAESDEELGDLAAGPVEHLLGWHAAEYIGRIEVWAATDPKVARMLTGVWKHMMSDDTWARIRAIQARVPNPLSAYRPDADKAPPSP